jgi:uncharacterized protein (TIGR02452 family)
VNKMFDKKAFQREIAAKTVEITKTGSYKVEKKEVSIKNDLDKAITGSILYTPKMIDELDVTTKGNYQTIVEVRNETTLHAAKRLKEEGYSKVVALNFASARKPGGGFLNGATAQEESLAYASGLYPCIAQMKEMYEYNEKFKSALYSDYTIYSPEVPVFRSDSFMFLENPYNCSFITMPAPNAGILKEREPNRMNELDAVMKRRIEKTLTLGVAHGYDAIVLGAFGCGVFQNDPWKVAKNFSEFLYKDDRFKGQFKKVIFAVLDKEPNTPLLSAFRNTLGGR